MPRCTYRNIICKISCCDSIETTFVSSLRYYGVVISIIVPSHNELQNIRELYSRICATMDKVSMAWELIFIDDSSDSTFESIRRVVETDERVKGIKLTRSFGQSAAILAGLEHCKGDCAIVMDCDGQDPPELIPELVSWWKSGFDVVLTQRISKGTKLYKIFASAFYSILNRFSEVNMPKESGEFRLIDRKVIQYLKNSKERNTFFRGQSIWPGYKVYSIRYNRKERINGHSNYGFWRSFKVAATGIFGFTIAPLRLFYFAASIFFLITLIIVAIWTIGRLINPEAFSDGWMSIIFFIFLTSTLNTFFLAMIGEYVARTFEEVLARPRYVISELLEQIQSS